MGKQEVRYCVTLKTYHQAALYGLVMRNRKVFRLAFLMLGGVIIYTVYALSGAVALHFLPIFMAGAYLVYLLILLAREEHRVLRYAKSENSMIGTEYILRFDAHTLSIEIVKTKERLQAAMKKFPAAVETGAFFLLYVDAATCYIVPTPDLSEEQRGLLRAALQENLGERFMSRFVK